MAGVLLDSHWKRLAALLEHSELADHPDYATSAARIAHREEVNALLSEWTSGRTLAEVVEAFADAGIPAAPVRTYAQAARDPHVRERDMLQTVRSSEGEVPVVGPAAKLSRTPTRVRTAAPSLGQHNKEILEELGYEAGRLEALMKPPVE